VTPLFLAVGLVSTIVTLLRAGKVEDTEIMDFIVAILFFWFWIDVIGRMWLGIL